jgi:fused signal recognition particle receptor
MIISLYPVGHFPCYFAMQHSTFTILRSLLFFLLAVSLAVGQAPQPGGTNATTVSSNSTGATGENPVAGMPLPPNSNITAPPITPAPPIVVPPIQVQPATPAAPMQPSPIVGNPLPPGATNQPNSNITAAPTAPGATIPVQPTAPAAPLQPSPIAGNPLPPGAANQPSAPPASGQPSGASSSSSTK